MKRPKFVLITGICILVLATLTVFHYSRGEEAKNIPKMNISENSKQEEIEEVESIKSLVSNFGDRLKMVSLLAPEDVLLESIEKNYGKFISKALLEKWKAKPQTAPGRLTSSPWPDRIEILSIVSISKGVYEVKGMIIEVTSTEQTSEEATSKIPVVLKIVEQDGRWLIDELIIDNSFIPEN